MPFPSFFPPGPKRYRVTGNDLAIVTAVAALGAAATWHVFLGYAIFSDEGSYCAIAHGILDGLLPYRDLFNEKAPGHYYLTAVWMAVAGPGFESGRALAALLLGVVFSVIALIARQSSRSMVDSLSIGAITWLVALTMRAQCNLGESALAVIAVVTVLLVPAGSTGMSRLRAFWIGALGGLAIGFRQTSLVAAVAMMFIPGNKETRLALGIGTALGCMAWGSVLAATGTLRDFIDAALLFHLDGTSLWSYPRGLSKDSLFPLVAWLFAFAIAAVRLRGAEGPMGKLLVWAPLLALPFLGRMDGFRLYPSFAALVAISAKATVFSIPPRLAGPRTRLRLALVLALLAVLANGRGGSIAATERISNAVRQLAPGDDPIWVGPFDPMIYCALRRHSPSKYYFVLPWTTKPRVWADVNDKLARGIPSAVVTIPSEQGATLEELLPGSGSILKRRYEVAEVIGRYTIWVRRNKEINP